MNRGWTVFLGALAIGVAAWADPADQPTMPSDLPSLQGRPDEAPSTQPALGPAFSSQAAGISLRPPAGSKTITRAGSEAIVEFINEEAKTTLRVTHVSLTKPIPLTIPASTPGPVINGEKDKGLLEMTAAQLTRNMPNSKVLRQNVMPLAGHDAGILMLRATNGVQHQLIQQAIIQANEQSYYNIIYSTPGESFDKPVDQPSDAERLAVKTFEAVLDSVQVMDPEKLRLDQEDRLFRTRSLLVNWTDQKLKSVLVPEQYIRVIRDGKDIGYSYIVEEPETIGTIPGLKIGIRSRTVPEGGQQIDGETWYHVSFDRKIENWSSIWLFTGGTEKYHATEFGSSEQRRKPVAIDRLKGDDIGPVPTTQRSFRGENLGVKLVDVYTLAVHRVNKKVTLPDVERVLPPFYLPQALGHLLPRLMPTNEPRGYLFASYLSGEAQVKLRYIDVGVLSTLRFNGKKIEAYPITDRFGYDGAITTHYVDQNHKYIGSESVFVSDAGVRSVIDVVVSDAATVTSIWADAKFVRPTTDPVVPID